MEITGLRTKIDSSGALAGAQDYENAARRIVAASQQIHQATSQISGQAMPALASSLKQAAPAAGELSVSIGSLSNSFINLKNILIAFATGEMFRSLIDNMRQFQQIRTTLEAVGGSAEVAAGEYNFMRQQVERLGLSLPVTAQGYATFLASLKDTPLQGQKAREVFVGLSEAISALHLSTDRAQRAWIAVQEIASQGIITTAHLQRQLAIDIPGAANLMAKGLGISTAQLHEFQRQGLLTADVALPAMARAMHEQYGAGALQAADMTQGLTNRMATAWTELKQTIVNAGFEDGFRNIMHALLDLARSPATKEFAQDIGHALGVALTMTANLLDLLRYFPETFHNAFGVDPFDAVKQGAYLFWFMMKDVANFTIGWATVFAARLEDIKNNFKDGAQFWLAAAQGDIGGMVGAAGHNLSTRRTLTQDISDLTHDYVGEAMNPLLVGTGQLGKPGSPVIGKLMADINSTYDVLEERNAKRMAKIHEHNNEIMHRIAVDIENEMGGAVEKVYNKWEDRIRELGKILKTEPSRASEVLLLQFKAMAAEWKEIYDGAMKASEIIFKMTKPAMDKQFGSVLQQSVFANGLPLLGTSDTPKRSGFGFDLMTKSIKELNSAISEMTIGAERGTRNVGQYFQNMAEAVVAALQKIVTEMIITYFMQQLTGFILGATGIGRPSSVPGGAVGSPQIQGLLQTPITPQLIPGHAFGGIQGVDRFDFGGITRRPSLFSTSEMSHPEAIVPLPNGREIPVNLRGSFGGAPNVSVIVENHGTPQQEVGRSMRYDPAAKEWVLRVITENYESGGVMRRMVGRKA